jgi:hypothetical protein
MNVENSRARSSQANTHAVMIPSNSSRSSVPKNASQSTSPWPMSRCWCTRTVDPGGLTM